MSELQTKLDRMRALLAERQLDALLLQRVSSFAWATCGAASYINTAATDGVGALLITPEEHILITNTIEAPRFEHEEGLAAQGWRFHVSPWHAAANTVASLTEGLRVGSDLPVPGMLDLSADVASLRSHLTPEEDQRFRDLGRLCAGAMDEAIRAVRPGMSEHKIAALLARSAESRGVQAIVNLIAADRRIFAYRHPLPTGRTLERYAMVVLCGRRSGLVCSLTRLVHFGPLPDDLRRKAEAVATVDATFIAATRPGRLLGEIFAEALAAYTATGFGDEWQLHHQGGIAAYEPRELVATPASVEQVAEGQAYAWNPSITGTKSEDTILVGPNANEIISAIPGWPTIAITVDGQTIARPAILEA